MPEQEFIIDELSAGLRLDVFLAKHLTQYSSRTAVRRVIDGGHVLVNDQPVSAHHKMHVGDRVVVGEQSPGHRDVRMNAEPIALDILYEDEDLVVINKPVGMLVHPVHGQVSGTLVNALLYHCGTLSDLNEENRPGIVHRLDRETSGIIVAVKNNAAHVALAHQFEKHKVIKRYVAIVKGCLEQDEGKVDAPIARHPVYFDKKTVSYNPEQGKSAYTFYKVLKRFGSRATLVALLPKTGRTHQLRVHMKYLGHPILGDDKYGDVTSFPRLALHAQSMCFWHPGYESFLEFSVPLPEEFLQPEEMLERKK